MSLILAAGEILQVVMDAAGTTRESIVRASFAVQGGNVSSATVATTGTTAATVVQATANSTASPGLAVSGLVVKNLDTVAHTVSVQAVTATTPAVTAGLLSALLQPGWALVYESGTGWQVLNTAGLVQGAAGGFSSQTAGTVFAGPISGAPAGPNFRSLVASDLPIGQAVSGDYIAGLPLIWNSATSISVGTGSAAIPALGRLSTVNSPLTLSGLTLTASTWYHVYLYESAGVPQIECVTTAPVIYQGRASQKTGDNTRRYLGSVRASAGGSILNFYHDANSNEVMYLVDINTADLFILNTGTASVLTTVSASNAIPVTSRVMNLFAEDTATNGAFAYLNNSLVSPSTGILFFIRAIDQTVEGRIVTDASQAIRYNFSAAPTGGGLNLWVTGYIFER